MLKWQPKLNCARVHCNVLYVLTFVPHAPLNRCASPCDITHPPSAKTPLSE